MEFEEYSTGAAESDRCELKEYHSTRRELIASTCAAIMYDNMISTHLPTPVADCYLHAPCTPLLAGAMVYASGKMADWCAHIAMLVSEQIANKVLAGEMTESEAYDYAREVAI